MCDSDLPSLTIFAACLTIDPFLYLPVLHFAKNVCSLYFTYIRLHGFYATMGTSNKIVSPQMLHTNTPVGLYNFLVETAKTA